MIDKTLWTNANFARQCMEADERLRSAPHTLTDADIFTMDKYHGNAEQARRKRDTALAELHAKAAPRPTTPSAASWRKGEDISEWAKRAPDAPTPIRLFNALLRILKERKAAQDATRDDLAARVSAPEGTPMTPTARATPKPRVRLRGMWEAAGEYAHGDAVVRHGLLWKCAAGPTREPPRPGAVCWRVLDHAPVAGDGAGDGQS